MTNTTLETGMTCAFVAPAETKWSPRRTLLFVTGSSLALWGLIVLAAVQLT